MQIAFLILLSVLPALFLLWFFERQDKGRKEPLKLKWKIFIWGLLATIAAGIIELNIEDLLTYLSITPKTVFWIYILIESFIVAALVEEGLKFLVVKKFIFKDKHFDEVMDGITYTIIASLGFAMLENVLYVLDGGYKIAILRSLTSVPAHAMFSGIMGYYIGKSKFSTPTQSKKFLLIGLGFAILYHGLFNFFLSTEGLLVLCVIPLLVIMGLHLKVSIRKARFQDKVDKTAPLPITFKRILKVISTTILIAFGLGIIASSLYIYITQELPYTPSELLGSASFGCALLVASYFILKKKKK